MKEIGEASRWDRRGRRWCTIFGIVSAVFLVFRTEASALDTIYMAITPGKNFQHVIYPIAQEKDYMWEEGIDLKLLIIGATPSIQGLIAGSIQFTVAGTSALMLIRFFQQTPISCVFIHERKLEPNPEHLEFGCRLWTAVVFPDRAKSEKRP